MAGSGMGGFSADFVGKSLAAIQTAVPGREPSGRALDPQKQTVEELKKINTTLDRKLGMH